MLSTTVVARVRRTGPTEDRMVVVLQCPDQCGQYHHPVVDFATPDAPVVRFLPLACACGLDLHTPRVLRDVIGTARNLIEAAQRNGGVLS
jgi:hypothetical protein